MAPENMAPNVDEIYVIFKTAVEQCNFIGAFTMNVIFLQLSLHMLRTISKIKQSSKWTYIKPKKSFLSLSQI